MAISRQKEARSRDYALLLFRMSSRVPYSAQYHRQPCTPHAFEQFGALQMHSHDDKYPSRPGFEPGSSRLQAPVDTNEPSGRAQIKIEYWTSQCETCGQAHGPACTNPMEKFMCSRLLKCRINTWTCAGCRTFVYTHRLYDYV